MTSLPGVGEWVRKELNLTATDLQQPLLLKKKGSVFYLVMNTKANTFTKDFVRSIDKLLDEIEASEGAAALVTVSLSKLFSGGLDLKFVSNLPKGDQHFFVLEFINLIGRLSVFPIPTVALVSGAAVAGGCMFAFSHDFIFVAQKAIFACNEVDIGLPLPPGMMASIRKRHSSHLSLRDMTLFGKKFSET